MVYLAVVNRKHALARTINKFPSCAIPMIICRCIFLSSRPSDRLQHPLESLSQRLNHNSHVWPLRRLILHLLPDLLTGRCCIRNARFAHSHRVLDLLPASQWTSRLGWCDGRGGEDVLPASKIHPWSSGGIG